MHILGREVSNLVAQTAAQIAAHRACPIVLPDPDQADVRNMNKQDKNLISYLYPNMT